MTVALTVAVLFIAVIFLVWKKESRVFLFFFHQLAFAYRRGAALYIDKRKHFPESRILENNWKKIKTELLNAIDSKLDAPRFHQVDKANHKISFDNGPAWRTIVLKAYDGWFAENCERFPETYKLLQMVPSVSTAMFSILEPHTCIPAHTGKLSGVLRYHLALQVPATGECYIEVNKEKYYWKPGEGILFNDTYLHAVVNNSDEYRVVLFIDVKRKSSKLIRIIHDGLMQLIVVSPVFKKALKAGSISTG
jgi:aspartyl/asparaginyl beta-hydroxylase (cupin superfamily)